MLHFLLYLTDYLEKNVFRHKSMEIIKAQKEQAPAIFNVLKACAIDMRSKGIMQWNENYPTPVHVANDLEADNLYIATENGAVAGVISIDDRQSPEYKAIDWQFTTGRIMVVHRLAVSPAFQKRGLGRKLMDFALEHAITNDYSAIRLDAYSLNDRTIKFYKNRGYHYRGDIYFAYRDAPFFCFEKKIK